MSMSLIHIITPILNTGKPQPTMAYETWVAHPPAIFQILLTGKMYP